jgi:hypothetical protein
LLHIQFLNQVKCLKNKADISSPEYGALSFVQLKQILPIYKNSPGRIQPANAIQQRTFPRP